MHRPWAACACWTQGLHSSHVVCATFSTVCLLQLSFWIYAQLYRRRPTAKARFLCYKNRYVRCNILHFIPATENVIEMGCDQGMYHLRVSAAFGVFKRSGFPDGSWAFFKLKQFECTSFVITLLYRFKTYKPQTPKKHSFPTPKFYKIAEINFNQ